MLGDNLYQKALKEALKENPDYSITYELLMKAISKNNPDAYYAVGTWYLFGTYVKKDISKAFEYIKIAAEKKNPNACYDLAVFYEKGIVVNKDREKAVELYLMAALNGEKQSFYELGRCYNWGLGIPKNKKIAKIWFDKANEFGLSHESQKSSNKKNNKT